MPSTSFNLIVSGQMFLAISTMRLLKKPASMSGALFELSSMSYNLHRLKVAKIARCISDQMPRDANDATCKLILSLDSRLESYIQNPPASFRVENCQFGGDGKGRPGSSTYADATTSD